MSRHPTVFSRHSHPSLYTITLIILILPVLLFFLAQRVFMQGVVYSGVEK